MARAVARYTTSVASAARAVDGNSSAISAVDTEYISVGVDVTAQSGTTPTLDVSIEWSFDETTWFVGDTADAFTQIAAATPSVVKRFEVKAPSYRIVWVIDGTTPSYTFSVITYDDAQPVGIRV